MSDLHPLPTYAELERLALPSPAVEKNTDEVDKYFEYQAALVRARHQFNQYYSWAIPTEDIIKKIVAFTGGSRILEVSCGNGLWAALIKQAGGDIIATDSNDWKMNLDHAPFFPIEELSALNAVMTIHAELLFLCWPTYGEPFSDHALKFFKGKKVVYIAEHAKHDARDEFIKELDAEWELVEEAELLQFDGVSDTAKFYERPTDE